MMKIWIFLIVVVVLIACFAQVASQSQDEELPSMLLESSRTGNVEGILNALGNGEDIMSRNVNGWSAAMFAVESGSIDALRTLIERGIDVNMADSNGITPLTRAAALNDKEMVEILLNAGANPDYVAQDGHTTPYSITTRKLIATLLAEHSLIYGILNDYPDDMLLDSLQRGAYIDLATGSGWTALIYGSSIGNLDLVKELLSQGAHINHQEQDGWTALHFAANNGHMDVVKALLDQGADFMMVNAAGLTAHDLAVNNHHDTVAEILPMKST